MTPDTVAVLLEPVQGEAGVVVPPPGYLAAVRRICDEAGVLMVADEVQSGLGPHGAPAGDPRRGRRRRRLPARARRSAAAIVPLSAVVADEAVLGVLRPGQHGSTFGGNPLACAVGSAVVDLLADPAVLAHAARAGRVLAARLEAAGRARRRGGADRRAVGGHRRRPAAGQRPGRLRGPGAARGAREGHARRDAADVPAAGRDGRRDRRSPSTRSPAVLADLG